MRELQAFLQAEGRPERLKPGGLARRIFEEAPAKGFSQGEAAQLMRDYINPSLDTTISALGFAAWYFAKQPEQWDILRDDPSLVGNAVEEIVRLSTPIRAFSRYVVEDYVLGGVVVPEGTGGGTGCDNEQHHPGVCETAGEGASVGAAWVFNRTG